MTRARRTAGVLTVLVLAALTTASCGDDEPTAREVVISGDAELEVSMWCADPPPTNVGVVETDTEVRLIVAASGDHDCETAKTVTLEEPLGTRTIVDGRTGRVLPVSFDFRCAPSVENGRCDGVETGPPATPLS